MVSNMSTKLRKNKHINLKHTVRELKNNKGRFFSVLAIICVSVAFTLGLMASPQTLQLSMEAAYTAARTAHLTLQSDGGITDADLQSIKQASGVTGARGYYEAEAVAQIGGEETAARIYTADFSAADGADYVNNIPLISGRLPQAEGECLAERSGNFLLPVDIGGTVTLSRVSPAGIAGTLKTYTYTVVGITQNPLYSQKTVQESASVGSGRLGAVIYIDDTEFALNGMGVYTHAALTTDLAADGGYFSDSFRDNIVPLADALAAHLHTATAKTWYCVPLTANPSYSNFYQNANMILRIALIFPPFFLLVAALTSLSSMVRMTEENRVKAGILKSLGYSKFSILNKYLFFSLTAAFSGCALGVALGYTVIPSIIFNVFTAAYYLPAPILRTSAITALIISAGAILPVLAVTLYSVLRMLRERASALLVAPAPKAGKRILLERIGFIWKRLSFKYKSTMRNIFRSKKQLIMTVVGVAGCTALTFAAFGIYGSLNGVTQRQYGEIIKYDLSVSIFDTSKPAPQLQQLLGENEELLALGCRTQYMYVSGGTFSQQTQVFILPADIKTQQLISLRPRGDSGSTFVTGTVAVTEMLAKEARVAAGDYITVINGDVSAQIAVTIVTENYMGTAVYIERSVFESAFPSADVSDNTVLIKGEFTAQDKDALTARLISDENISGVQFSSALESNYESILSNMLLVILLLIATAGALSFIVIYNITIISISERKKEVSALKVLGYTNFEVMGYVYREIFLMILLGILVGLVFGTLLHLYVIVQIDSTMVMLTRGLGYHVFLIAAGVTLLFSVITGLIAYPGLKKIKMTESMKQL